LDSARPSSERLEASPGQIGGKAPFVSNAARRRFFRSSSAAIQERAHVAAAAFSERTVERNGSRVHRRGVIENLQ